MKNYSYIGLLSAVVAIIIAVLLCKYVFKTDEAEIVEEAETREAATFEIVEAEFIAAPTGLE
ncbi:MAG: hypothetical protein LUG52_07455 [Clostridia bacterium]|nr:hypothetical protein [Clostridia bacterium]